MVADCEIVVTAIPTAKHSTTTSTPLQLYTIPAGIQPGTLQLQI